MQTIDTAQDRVKARNDTVRAYTPLVAPQQRVALEHSGGLTIEAHAPGWPSWTEDERQHWLAVGAKDCELALCKPHKPALPEGTTT